MQTYQAANDVALASDADNEYYRAIHSIEDSECIWLGETDVFLGLHASDWNWVDVTLNNHDTSPCGDGYLFH